MQTLAKGIYDLIHILHEIEDPQQADEALVKPLYDTYKRKLHNKWLNGTKRANQAAKAKANALLEVGIHPAQQQASNEEGEDDVSGGEGSPEKHQPLAGKQKAAKGKAASRKRIVGGDVTNKPATGRSTKRQRTPA
jgi:hypothetical protein